MKHIKIYEDLTNIINVDDIIEKYGYDNAEFFLKFILKGKKVKIINGYDSKQNINEEVIGILTNIFYISTSGFIIARFENAVFKNGIYLDRDIIINRATISCDKYLDFDTADMIIKSKKYNL